MARVADPRYIGNLPKASGNVSEAPGNMSQSLGNVSQAPGNVSQSLGNVSQALGNVFGASGKVPGVSGKRDNDEAGPSRPASSCKCYGLGLRHSRRKLTPSQTSNASPRANGPSTTTSQMITSPTVRRMLPRTFVAL